MYEYLKDAKDIVNTAYLNATTKKKLKTQTKTTFRECVVFVALSYPQWYTQTVEILAANKAGDFQ